MLSDKKNARGKIRLILPRGLGNARLTGEFSMDALDAVLSGTLTLTTAAAWRGRDTKLAGWAVHDRQTRGRVHAEPDHPLPGAFPAGP